ncbi:MAG TPA: hypothetical protein VFW74_18440 [Acidimicrobiia bacterium]|nr:hypothetical protein [Acidimicrobiia bacterium]
MTGALLDGATAAGGAAIMAGALLTPFLRGARSRWGADDATASARFPGDELVPEPRWGWVHAVGIDAPAAAVWPWVAQIGADRGGFYSYDALENLVGCRVRSAHEIRPEWAVREGDGLRLHPRVPPLPVVSVTPGTSFLVFAPADADAATHGRPWVAVTWLFLVVPLGARRSRFVSRYRCATSDDLATRLQFGPALVEPISFAMDRRMLLGVKRRAERPQVTSGPARPLRAVDAR